MTSGMTRTMKSEAISAASQRIQGWVSLLKIWPTKPEPPHPKNSSGDMKYLIDLDVHCGGNQMNSSANTFWSQVNAALNPQIQLPCVVGYRKLSWTTNVAAAGESGVSWWRERSLPHFTQTTLYMYASVLRARSPRRETHRAGEKS